MAETTGIAWCDSTFNPWWLCTEVSPACDNCYARTLAARFGYGWGEGVPRRQFGDKHWNDPRRWARLMPEKLGRRPRVFCASMADWLDKDAPTGARTRLFELIEETPQLDWLMLTKRVGNARRFMPSSWTKSGLPSHVWFGITVANQEEVDRDLRKLWEIKARVRWLSVEPQLGRMIPRDPTPVDWVVCGGESGPRARRLEVEWAVALKTWCAVNGTPFFMKQGSAANWPSFGDFDSFPEALRVREFPN